MPSTRHVLAEQDEDRSNADGSENKNAGIADPYSNSSDTKGTMQEVLQDQVLQLREE
jgi:hypothetical protein